MFFEARCVVSAFARAAPIAAVALCLTVSDLPARATQNTEQEIERALDVIDPALVKSHVQFLAHDLLRGRDTDDVGFEVAKEYVAAHFTRIGLEPYDGTSYLQPFDLLESAGDRGSELRAGALTLREPETLFRPDWGVGESQWEGEGVFVGYGLAMHGRSDYAGVDVTGKAVFMLSGAPATWAEDWDRSRAAAAKAEIALRKGAVLVIELAAPGVRSMIEVRRPPPTRWRNPQRTIVLADGTAPRIRPHVSVTQRAAASLLGSWGIDPDAAKQAADEGTSVARGVGSVRVIRKHEIKRIRSWNVIGIVRGSDPTLRDESIVFTAHLDHVGIGPPDLRGDTINNGAHDNAIGSAKLMAAAEAMVRLRPRRSIVFAAVGAEERGLLGSWYYVRNPALPIEKTVANINQDGGREGVIAEDIIANAVDISDMYQIVRDVMGKRGVSVMDRDRALRTLVGFSSDHYPFLLAGVPAIDLKPGHTVEGDWEIGLRDRQRYMYEWRHKPADNFDPDLFTMESVAEMAKRAVWLAWHISEMDGRPELKADHAMWRVRGRPEQPYYFGPERAFDE